MQNKKIQVLNNSKCGVGLLNKHGMDDGLNILAFWERQISPTITYLV